MNNLNFISKNDMAHPANEGEMSIGRFNMSVNENQALQDGVDLATVNKGERRNHQRFLLNEDVYALIRHISTGPLKIEGKSMGCIACEVFKAQPAKLGIIKNISMGGLTFQHVDSKIPINDEFVLDILIASCGFYLDEMPFKTVVDFATPKDISGDSIAMRQVRLQFEKLNAIQQAKLIDLILNHGAEI